MAKVNKQKDIDTENFICNPYEEKLTVLNTDNINICG